MGRRRQINGPRTAFVTRASQGAGLWRYLRRNRFLLIALLLACMLFARVGCRVFLPSAGNAMENKYLQIKVGMTVEEVEGILGKPNVRNRPYQKIWRAMLGGKGGEITVTFKDGKVTDKEFVEIELPQPPRFPRP